jgi:hypothetical protein
MGDYFRGSYGWEIERDRRLLGQRFRRRIAPVQPPGRHHQVDRGQDEDLAGEAEQVEEHAGEAAERQRAAEQLRAPDREQDNVWVFDRAG